MTSSPPLPPERDDDDQAPRQERGALIVTLVAVLVVCLVGAPCFCYFGAGLFQGIHVLRTGQDLNPARQGFKRQGVDWRGDYKRPARYDRRFEPGETESNKSAEEAPSTP